MNRQRLQRTIKLMFLGLILAFVFVLLRSLSGPSNFTNPKTLFDDVVIGQTAARRLGNQRVWVTRLSDEQRQQAKQLDNFLIDPMAGCDSLKDLCVLAAASNRAGIDITFTTNPPIQLSSKSVWFGGFVDPTTGEVFDRLGRAYKEKSTANLSDTRTQLTVIDH